MNDPSRPGLEARAVLKQLRPALLSVLLLTS